ncbi:MAG TPA: excinuclease ABC subunit UvrA, partial [Candidatus Aminicenantes bacterium]|nr:excinuclease ABC subunit UvrA [Candidatus Aminicenantes bacterium]
FLFDEPSTGLHHADVHRLLGLFDVLNRAGHTVAVADHRLQIVARAHHLIDLGPGGGKEGGRVVFHGSPREMVARGTGKTADALREWVRPAPGDTGGSSGPGAPRDGERP